MALTLNINGEDHVVDADFQMPLLWAIREKAGLTGTKFGCGIAQCGACTVIIDNSNNFITYLCIEPQRTKHRDIHSS